MKELAVDDDGVAKYIAGNNEARQFLAQNQRLCVASLRAFKEKYYSGKSSLGAKFSERVFIYWLYKEVERFSPTVRPQDKLPLILQLRDGEAEMEKRVDLSLEYGGRKIIVELKTNIDMIEKDLYKLYLCHRFGPNEHIEKVLLVWEVKDNRFNRGGTDSQYYSLIKLAQHDGVLDKFIYLPIEPESEGGFLEEQLDELRSFLAGEQ